MSKRAGLFAIAFAAVAGSAAAWAGDTIPQVSGEAARSRPVLKASADWVAGIPVSPVQVPDPAPALIAAAEKSASALGGTPAPHGTLVELSSSQVATSQPVRVATTPQLQRERPRLSTAGPAAPADPWVLLCALAVVAYIALKKLRIVSGAGWSERITPGNHL